MLYNISVCFIKFISFVHVLYCIINPFNYTDKIQFDSFSNCNSADGYLFIKFSIIE